MATKDYPQLLNAIAKADISRNMKDILLAMLTFTPIGSARCMQPSAEIAHRADVGKATVDRTIKQLIEEGLVRSEGKARMTRRYLNEGAILALPPRPLLNHCDSNHPDSNHSEAIIESERGNQLNHSEAIIESPRFNRIPQDVDTTQENAHSVRYDVREDVGLDVSPPLSPPPGGYRRWSRRGSEEGRTQVLNGNGQQKTTSEQTLTTTPRLEERPTPQQAIQDPPAFTLTPPPATKVKPRLEIDPKNALKMPTDITPRNDAEKAEIEAIKRVYAHYVEGMKSPGMMAQSDARRDREKRIRKWLRHPEFVEADLIAAIDGCLGDDWRVSKGQTGLLKYILRDEESVHMFKNMARKKTVAAPRPTEYRNKKYERDDIEHFARIVLSERHATHTEDSMSRMFELSQEETRRILEAVKVKYNGNPLPPSRGFTPWSELH